MKNQLILRNPDYPFKYFPEAAFYKEQVVGLIANSYELEVGAGAGVVQPHVLSLRDVYSITLAKIGRIVHLDEDHYDLFYSSEFNEFIRDLAQEYNNDLIKVLEQFMNRSSWGITVNREMMEDFEKDVKKVFDIERMFYLDTNVPYDSLEIFHRDGDPSPFSEKSLNKLFRNIPVVRVW